MATSSQQLLELASAARAHAHAPYSGFAVGAAVLAADGRSFTGCNVENASYGLSICAERAAIFAAVTAGMRPGELVAVAVVAGTAAPVTPCGACRQVIAEFAAQGCVVVCGNLERASTQYSAGELLPAAFRLPG
jgi:cytidine deaminase